MKVLLIDDHPLILQALQLVIESLGSGIAVITADSAAGQARHSRRKPISISSCLICSLAMPMASEVLAEFRSVYPTLPVVVVSASDRASDVIRSIDLGAMGFVPKRASNASLFEALNMVMSAASTSRRWRSAPESATPRVGEGGALRRAARRRRAGAG